MVAHQLEEDEKQATAFQQGEEKALEYFFTRLYPTLTLYAFQWVKDRPSVEEIVSEAFVKTWQKHRRLNSFAGIRAYLYTVVRRDSSRAAARLHKERKLFTNTTPELLSTNTPFEYLLRAETYRLVHAALGKLSPGNRQVIAMHYLEGKTTAQIARQLNLHPQTVQTHKTRGIKALLKILQPTWIAIAYFFEKYFCTL